MKRSVVFVLVLIAGVFCSQTRLAWAQSFRAERPHYAASRLPGAELPIVRDARHKGFDAIGHARDSDDGDDEKDDDGK